MSAYEFSEDCCCRGGRPNRQQAQVSRLVVGKAKRKLWSNSWRALMREFGLGVAAGKEVGIKVLECLDLLDSAI